jgi:ATP-binding cassette subfamily B multidrug efflux pump
MTSIDLIKPHFRVHRGTILLGLFALMLVDLLQLLIPRVVKWAVDDLTLYRTALPGLLRYGAYIVCLGLLIGGFRYVWRRCLLGTAQHLEENLRNQLFAHLQTLSAAYFDRTKTGDLMAHATNDLQQVRMAAGMGMVAFNDAVVMGTAAIAFMLAIHVQLTLYVLIPMPLIVIGTKLASKRMHRRYLQVQGIFADLTEAVRERFAGIRIIKAHSCQGAEAARVGAISRDYIDRNIQLTKVTGLFFPMMMFLTNLSLAMVMLIGGRQTILGHITPGDFVAFISYLGLLTWPMMALGWVANLIQRGRASLDRIHGILSTQPQIADGSLAVGRAAANGHIAFQGVRFGYDPNRRPALTDLSFDLPTGQVLGIVGPPGSGKSTLLNLLMRFYDVQDGFITLGDVDLRNLPLRHLRRQVCLAPQEPFLFAGTIRDNITFGDPRVNAAALERVTHLVCLDDTIAAFPKGYDTVVGEKGVILSGGQKQRVVLARALLKDAPVLLLDDPVSQVDAATAARIIGTLRDLSGTRTLVIVSHRLSAVSFADQIMVLSQGRIQETGTHRQLMARGGYYTDIYQLQEIEDAL